MDASENSISNAWNYPPVIYQLLDLIVEELRVKPGVLEILLLGSTSRGELSYQEDNDGVRLYGDIEFLVFSSKKYNDADLMEELQVHVPEGIIDTPLYHVDLAIITEDSLKGLRPLMRLEEARLLGHVMYGNGEYQRRLPNLSIRSWDKSDGINILVSRYASMFFGIPSNAFENREAVSRGEDDYFNYIMIRNALDVLSVYLLAQNQFIPGYQQRYIWLKSNTDKILKIFGDCFTKILIESHERKINNDFKHLNIPNYFANILHALQKVSLHTELIPTEVWHGERINKRLLVKDPGVTKWMRWALWEMFLAVRFSGSPLKRFLWFHQSKRFGIIGLFHELLTLIGSELSWVESSTAIDTMQGILKSIEDVIHPSIDVRRNKLAITRATDEFLEGAKEAVGIELARTMRFGEHRVSKLIKTGIR